MNWIKLIEKELEEGRSLASVIEEMSGIIVKLRDSYKPNSPGWLKHQSVLRLLQKSYSEARILKL